MINVTSDPGHGGLDRYNRGPNGYVEADGNLKKSIYLKEELEATGQFNVSLTRDCDKTLSLKERAMIAVNNKADMFISQHDDAAGSSARGVTVFHSVDIPSDKALAEKFASEIASAMGTVNRGAKSKESTIHKGEDYYGVIDYAQDNGIPHVFIIESGFHTNPEDEAILLNDDNIRKIAKAQAKVICEFYNVQYLIKPVEEAPQVVPVSAYLDYHPNAYIVKDYLYGRKEDGSIEQGRRVDIGDKIEVLDISHSKQLTLVLYPTPSGVRKTYVTNCDCIQFLNPYNAVASVKANIRQTSGGTVIGSIGRNEKVTVLSVQGNWTNVAYDTSKGKHTKSGWVESKNIKIVRSV
jgi:N-acetylmuramoyl-L-alanine amidase